MSETSVNLPPPDAELDLRGVICPYNFVKTKLKLETMEAGQLLLVRLDEEIPSATSRRASATRDMTFCRKSARINPIAL